MWPTPDAGLRYEPVAAADFESLLALRIRAMQPSLEALGRFSPERARERFAASFAPGFMQHVLQDGRRVGCVTLRPTADALQMDHLYIEPTHQGCGIGAAVMEMASSLADLRQVPLQLLVLKGSAANRFYQRHGLVAVGEGEWDLEYRRLPCAHPAGVVRALWERFQARDWAAARALLHDDARIRWWASGETLGTADAYIAVNREYPEGWTIHTMRLDTLQDGRVLSFARVEHPPAGTFLAQTLMRVRDGRIAHGEELWATCEAPPAWRTPQRFAGLERD